MRRYYFREDSKEPREYLRQSLSSRGNSESRSGNVRDGVSTHNEWPLGLEFLSCY